MLLLTCKSGRCNGVWRHHNVVVNGLHVTWRRGAPLLVVVLAGLWWLLLVVLMLELKLMLVAAIVCLASVVVVLFRRLILDIVCGRRRGGRRRARLVVARSDHLVWKGVAVCVVVVYQARLGQPVEREVAKSVGRRARRGQATSEDDLWVLLSKLVALVRLTWLAA